MNCMCFSLRSFSWVMKEIVEACIRAKEIVITNTRKMDETAFSYSCRFLGMGHGLFTVVNLTLGSPVASLMIDSYMNCG